jgi:hypothetical protein
VISERGEVKPCKILDESVSIFIQNTLDDFYEMAHPKKINPKTDAAFQNEISFISSLIIKFKLKQIHSLIRLCYLEAIKE